MCHHGSAALTAPDGGTFCIFNQILRFISLLCTIKQRTLEGGVSALLYVGLGLVAVGMVITFVGLGDKVCLFQLQQGLL